MFYWPSAPTIQLKDTWNESSKESQVLISSQDGSWNRKVIWQIDVHSFLGLW